MRGTAHTSSVLPQNGLWNVETEGLFADRVADCSCHHSDHRCHCHSEPVASSDGRQRVVSCSDNTEHQLRRSHVQLNLSKRGLCWAPLDLGGALGVACVPSSTTACLVDAVVSNNGNPAKSGTSGYMFSTGTGTVPAGVNVGFTVLAVPITINQTGIRAFCAEEDSVVRVDPRGACSNSEAGVLTFNPPNQ